MSPIRDTVVLGSVVASHERLKIEQSAKYSEAGYTRLWAEAGFTEQSRWTRGDDYGKFVVILLCQPLFPTTSSHVSRVSSYVARVASADDLGIGRLLMHLGCTPHGRLFPSGCNRGEGGCP